MSGQSASEQVRQAVLAWPGVPGDIDLIVFINERPG